MIPEIKIIHQLAENSIFEASSKSEADLKAWIANGDYLLEEKLIPAGNNSAANNFKLRFRGTNSISIALANDCNRFAQAAIESMWCISKVERLPKSTAWASIKMYYSAFFAAHALLRLFGRACTQLESHYVNAVYRVANGTDMTGDVRSIENGFYIAVMKGQYIEYIKLKDSHADTWSSFYQLLNDIINDIPSTSGLGEYKSDAIDLVSNIKRSISQSGAHKGNWPSQLRNKINYQHSYGAWYPYKNAVHNQEAILKKSDWLRDPKVFDLNTGKDEITSLYNASNSILSLMYQIMKYGYERAGKISSPLANGTFRLLNQIKV